MSRCPECADTGWDIGDPAEDGTPMVDPNLMHVEDCRCAGYSREDDRCPARRDCATCAGTGEVSS